MAATILAAKIGREKYIFFCPYHKEIRMLEGWLLCCLQFWAARIGQDWGYTKIILYINGYASGSYFAEGYKSLLLCLVALS